MTSRGHPAVQNRVLARNTIWNVAGVTLPIVAAVISIPLLATHLGPEQFGLLGVVWAVAGYFGILDLGLGKALTRAVADRLGQDDLGTSLLLTRTTIVLLGILGLGGAVILFAASTWLADSVLQMAPEVEASAPTIFRLLAASIPVALVSSGLVGALEGLQRFDLVNIVRTPFGIATFALPAVAVAGFGAGLEVVVIVIVAARFIAAAVYGVLVAKVLPSTGVRGWFDRSSARFLVRFGGWLTVSSIAAPFLMSSDRIIIGILLSVTAVGFYTAPYEIAIRLLVIPVAISGVTFAAMSATFASSRARAVRIMRGSATVIFVLVYPISFLLVAFAGEILMWWVGGEYATEGTAVLQILAFGILANSIATAPFAAILASNRPDWTAKLHMLEVPIYLAALFLLVPSGGIVAAAAVWTARVGIDALVVVFLANRISPTPRRLHIHSAWILAASFSLMAVAPGIDDTALRAAYTAVSLIAVGVVVFTRYRAEQVNPA